MKSENIYRKEIQFIFIFLFVSTFLYVFVYRFYSEDLPIVGTNNVAFVLYKILNIISINSIIYDSKIYLPNGNSLSIILECTGLYEMIILSSIIAAYPTNLTDKFYGIIAGLAVIYLLNMIRLITIAYVLIFYTDKFDFIERYIWQISLIILISVAYTVWLKMINSNLSSNSL